MLFAVIAVCCCCCFFFVVVVSVAEDGAAAGGAGALEKIIFGDFEMEKQRAEEFRISKRGWGCGSERVYMDCV